MGAGKAWSWADVARAPVEPEPTPSASPARPALAPLTLEQRQRLTEIEAAMLAERRAVWLPWVPRSVTCGSRCCGLRSACRELRTGSGAVCGDRLDQMPVQGAIEGAACRTVGARRPAGLKQRAAANPQRGVSTPMAAQEPISPDLLWPGSQVDEPPAILTELTPAIIRVGCGARGFIVAYHTQRLVITAAHCLPWAPASAITRGTDNIPPPPRCARSRTHGLD